MYQKVIINNQTIKTIMKEINSNFKQSENVDLIIPALIKFNVLFQDASLKKDKTNPFLGNAYISLDQILNVIRPILSSCDLVIVQNMTGSYFTTALYHASGQYLISEMPFSAMNGSKGTNDLQNLGGGLSYIRRYAISSLLQLSVDTDTDGHGSNIKSSDLQKDKKNVPVEKFEELMNFVSEKPSRLSQVLKSYNLTESQIEQLKFLGHE
jgi:hypothetical protein